MQLALPVSLPSDETFASFVAGPNEELVALLQKAATSSQLCFDQDVEETSDNLPLPLITLAGGAGSGKSHLLYAICHEAEVYCHTHTYINVATPDISPAILEGLEHIALICLDNVDDRLGHVEWEEALFDLFNRVSETNKSVIVVTSRRQTYAALTVLPDLHSRMRWGLHYVLQELSDDDRLALLKLRAEQKGLHFSRQALQYILRHANRDTLSLMSLLERLDERSLCEKRKISVNMVKQELPAAD